ncbi:hypothetical protein EG329_003244 [Mollisiaceae sp. DMI_Dod_QoI]|nr:hypothetical protein EG329_003244 [Helotiales sp. DMI_Dod_QoI]
MTSQQQSAVDPATLADAELSGVSSQTHTEPPNAEPQAGPQDPFLSAFPTELEIGTDSSDQSSRDDDSALGLSIADSTVSLRSSIYDYMEENGRTYHAFNSGNLQHHSFKIMLDGKLHLAPLSKPQRVLDLATGTGIWAIEFAQEYPEAIVIGTDLSPIQPGYVPPNCQFQVDDAEEVWTFREPFDYIHARAIVTCFKSNRTMAQKIFDNLAPGGYFELQDPSFPMKCDDETFQGAALEEWGSSLVECMSRIGRNLLDTPNWGQYMREAGFIDIVEHRILVPVNPWARGKKNKILGAISQQNLLEGVASMSTAAFTRILGWSPERLEVFLARVRDDLKDKGIHAYGVVYFVYGRKPLE